MDDKVTHGNNVFYTGMWYALRNVIFFIVLSRDNVHSVVYLYSLLIRREQS